MTSTSTSESLDQRGRIAAAIEHLDHVLPGQGPIHEFVHHNTIHGFQHYPFEKALEEYEALTGTYGYLPETQNRWLYQQGRITDVDIFASLDHAKTLLADQDIVKTDTLTIKRKDIYKVSLVHELEALSNSQLKWQIEELNVLETVQSDVSKEAQERMFSSSTDKQNAVRHLWDNILNKLGVELVDLHPENMLDLSEDRAKQWLEKININESSGVDISVHRKMRQDAEAELDDLLSQIGDQITLRGFVLALSGIDILYSIRPQIIRVCASVMDEGVAAWQLPERGKLGLYTAWKLSVQYDANSFLHDLPEWQKIVAQTPDDPVECIIQQLTNLEIPEQNWEGYLQRLALEIPGWSGLINWREHNPSYHTDNNAELHLSDYLAIRLTLDRLWLNQACQDNWSVEAKLGTLKYYFRKNLSELLVRKKLYQGVLPEYLTHYAKDLILRTGSERHNQDEWRNLADLVWTWQYSPMAQESADYTAANSGWRLFRLSQHLGLTGDDVRTMQRSDLTDMLSLLDDFTAPERSKVWLYAYEYHYREDFLQSIHANLKRGRWAKRDQRPEAQVVFCIDEREESIRRQLEELNPAIETLGAAGFYGLPMNYKGLDDHHRTALCPIVVVPSHNVDEVPRKGTEQIVKQHNSGRNFFQKLAYMMNQSLRRSLIWSHAIIDAIAPVVFVGLLGRSFLPKYLLAINASIRGSIDKKVPTELLFNAIEPDTPATPEKPRLGFTDKEQADRVEAFMRNTGLTYGFSKIVSLMAHGSTSQNNPHEAAHDCGACSGKRGGPNARLFAAIVNRPVIRKILAERGIVIPDDTWFLGAEHDTCSDVVTWYDTEDVPENLRPNYEKLRDDLIASRNASAHERCRRFFSAKNPKTPAAGIEHVHLRSNDLSQVRPEYGHATNASAIVGRRSVSQGIFLDRRPFLISYDATQDPDGKFLENVLLAVGPVGAGINLEYYFSTIDNERFGCGTKIPHNITGLFGVMEGTSSDIRTGLPKQMIEVHEALRLQILVEAKTEILGEIYGRQPSIQELVGGGWVLLSAIDPDTGEISVFERGVGFVPWKPDEAKQLDELESSIAYYQDKNDPLPPVLIKQPNMTGA
ncbi:MAG: DUF2309 domain-containing protein [Nitrosomonas sp.]|nr:DUF2309 domain-containing protein [Nitrosomonas sp.]